MRQFLAALRLAVLTLACVGVLGASECPPGGVVLNPNVGTTLSAPNQPIDFDGTGGPGNSIQVQIQHDNGSWHAIAGAATTVNGSGDWWVSGVVLPQDANYWRQTSGILQFHYVEVRVLLNGNPMPTDEHLDTSEILLLCVPGQCAI